MQQSTRREAGGWQHDLYDLLRRHGVTQFAYVPDAGHTILIDRSLADPDVHLDPAHHRGGRRGAAAGADLGGVRAVLLMQSSGVGNCINMLSLIKGARFPFLTLVSMRGDFGEGNPWQFPMGQATQPVLEAMGVICLRIERPEEVIPTTTRGPHHGVQERPVGGGAARPAADRRQAVLRSTCLRQQHPTWPRRRRPASCSSAAKRCRR